ncbi:alpha/beta hydrolase [Candidatus Bathyarchaeota archaeon]|nr:alpha/beta hydrolase [Candidatus Bathyarchaeota archaeon]
MIEEKSFNTGEFALNYAEGPEGGPPLLLLHGTGNRWQAFIRLIPSLSTRWHVYALDLRGHGKSGRAPHYGFGYYCEDAVAFIDEVIREPTVLFGHSLGGRMALTIAANHPVKTRAIILGDSSLSAPSPSNRMGRGFSSLLEILEGSPSVKEIFQTLKKRAGEAFEPVSTLNRAKNLSMVDPEMYRSIVDNPDPRSRHSHFHGFNPPEHLPKVRCPVLILQAERGMLRAEDVGRALDILPEAYHVMLDDVPHEFLMYDTDPVLRAVTTFLESLM